MNACMKRKPFERIDFPQILHLLEPDLTVDFKSRSYYNNEYQFKKLKAYDDAKGENDDNQNYHNVNYANHSIELSSSISNENIENEQSQELAPLAENSM